MDHAALYQYRWARGKSHRPLRLNGNARREVVARGRGPAGANRGGVRGIKVFAQSAGEDGVAVVCQGRDVGCESVGQSDASTVCLTDRTREVGRAGGVLKAARYDDAVVLVDGHESAV